jgi:hypothetical protein
VWEKQKQKNSLHIPFLPDSNTMSLRDFLTTTFTGSSFVSGISSDFSCASNFPSCSPQPKLKLLHLFEVKLGDRTKS